MCKEQQLSLVKTFEGNEEDSEEAGAGMVLLGILGFI